jgi:hypothetical protein
LYSQRFNNKTLTLKAYYEIRNALDQNLRIRIVENHIQKRVY